MAETDQRSRVVKELKPLHAVAVENPCWPGTPDVNYLSGWIELKWLRSWPVREGPVRLDHFNLEQKLFLRRRWMSGGVSWLLIQCKREWLLIPGNEVKQVGDLTRPQLIELCVWYSETGIAGLTPFLRKYCR